MPFYRRYAATPSCTLLLSVTTPAANLTVPQKFHSSVTESARHAQVRGELQQRKVDAPEIIEKIKLPRREVSISEQEDSLHLVAWPVNLSVAYSVWVCIEYCGSCAGHQFPYKHRQGRV